MRKKLLLSLIFGALLVLLLAAPSLAASGSNTVGISSPSPVPSLQSSGGQVYIGLIEGSAGSLVTGNPSVSLTLPNGFQWGNVTHSVYSPQTIQCIKSGNDIRTLIITPSELSTTPNTVYITGTLLVDETVAKSGDVICQVGGYSSVSATTLTVATYTAPVNVANPAVHVTATNCPTIIAGKLSQTIGDITISEDSANQLIPNRTIILTLPDGAKWHYDRDPNLIYPVYPLNLSGAPLNTCQNGISLTSWISPNTLTKSIRTIVIYGSTASGSNILLRKGMIDVSPDFTGDLNITVSGSAGASGVVKVATVVAPVTVGVEAGSVPATILCGVQEQTLPNITIRENMAGAISLSNYSNTTLTIEFPTGVTPSLPTVQVTAGDLLINPSTISKSVTGDGRWCYLITLLYPSTQPSTITLSNIKVSVDQNVPLGPLSLAIKGVSVVETAWNDLFPGATVGARVTAGQVYLTAPVVNSGISLSGLVQVENGYDSGVTVSLVNPSTGSSIMQVFSDASGNYQFNNVPAGTYNVVVSHKGFLNATASTITVSTSAVSAPALSMKAGDLNGDNRIDLLDIATFAKNYGSVGN